MGDDERGFSPTRVLAEIRETFHDRSVLDVEVNHVKIVVFAAGNQRYVLYGKDVKEIIGFREIHPIPFLPPFIPGLIHLRGEIEAVMDPGLFLGIGKTQGTGTVILMVEKGRFRAGMMADAVVDVLDVAEDSIRPPLSNFCGVLRDVVSGTLDFAGDALPLLDVEKIALRIGP